MNPDGMTLDDLKKLSETLIPMTPERAANLFPDKPRGYFRAAKSLAQYVNNKLQAMMARIDGDIPAARGLEKLCDRIYDDLPKYARW